MLLVSLLFFSFSAKEEHVVKGKVIEYHPVLLDVAPMERIGGWSLAGEDPKLFSQDQLWKGGRREWPDEPYPTVSVAAGGARPKTTPVVSPADDEIEDPQPRGPLHPSDPQVKDLLQIHHSMVKLLRSMGVDACKEYSQSRLEVILDSIQSTDLECKVCGKVYKAAAKMKRHFRKRHLGKTNYKCDICEKYYTDATSLKTHQSSHDSGTPKIHTAAENVPRPSQPKVFWASTSLFMRRRAHLFVTSKTEGVRRSSSGRKERWSTCQNVITTRIGLKSHPSSVTLKSAQRVIGIKGLSCATTGRNLPISRTNKLCGYH